jgi:hypothetical protein
MKKLYLIRTEDFFTAMARGEIPEDCIREAGTIWITLALTDEERNKYTFPIDLLG